MNNQPYAPIVLLAYKRNIHFKKTIKALSENTISNKSNLYIFVDGPKRKQDTLKISKIIKEARKYQSLFKKVKIIERKKNLGLEKNITSAVTEIVNQYGKVIVVEDDIVTSKNFLEYMNNALDYYHSEKTIWHINAYSVTNEISKKNDIYLSRLMSCWGWGTWRDRWNYYKKDIDSILLEFSKDDIKNLNLDNCANFWDQVTENKRGLIKTWAIFWYVVIFQNKGLCVTPHLSYVKNIGFDGSGENSGSHRKLMLNKDLNHDGSFTPVIDIHEDKNQFEKIKRYYSKNIKIKRIKTFIKNFLPVFFVKNLKKLIYRL